MYAGFSGFFAAVAAVSSASGFALVDETIIAADMRRLARAVSQVIMGEF
jgi:hypothetical protein